MTDPSTASQNVILIGFMGTGKTSIGRQIAQSLGFEFVDTDEEIEAAEEKAITDIFAEKGEEYFRELETETLKKYAAGSRQVIATGGGVVLKEENRKLLGESGYVIWLKASPEAIFERVSRNRDRPLLHTEDPMQTIRDLLATRQDFYADTADITVDTDGLSQDETAFGICESARVIFGS